MPRTKCPDSLNLIYSLVLSISNLSVYLSLNLLLTQCFFNLHDLNYLHSKHIQQVESYSKIPTYLIIKLYKKKNISINNSNFGAVKFIHTISYQLFLRQLTLSLLLLVHFDPSEVAGRASISISDSTVHCAGSRRCRGVALSRYDDTSSSVTWTRATQ